MKWFVVVWPIYVVGVLMLRKLWQAGGHGWLTGSFLLSPEVPYTSLYMTHVNIQKSVIFEIRVELKFNYSLLWFYTLVITLAHY